MSKRSFSVYKGEVIIAGEIKPADTFFKRLCGLMPTKKLNEGSGILLKPCKQIHTYFMKYPIDAVFLSEKNTVINIEKNLTPGNITEYFKASKTVLETASGTADRYGIAVGDTLRFENN